jgi:hypothetical protein
MTVLNQDTANTANENIRRFIPNRNDEYMENLEAVPNNLENGEIVNSKIKKSAIFKEKQPQNAC